MDSQQTKLTKQTGYDDVKRVEILNRMRKWLYIMNLWFLFEHVFVGIAFSGRSDITPPLIVAVVFLNLIVNYYGFYGWYHIEIDLISIKTDDHRKNNTGQCAFYSLLVLQIVMFISCVGFGIRGMIGIATADIDEVYNGEFYYSMSVIGVSLNILSLPIIAYLIYLSYVWYKLK